MSGWRNFWEPPHPLPGQVVEVQLGDGSVGLAKAQLRHGCCSGWVTDFVGASGEYLSVLGWRPIGGVAVRTDAFTQPSSSVFEVPVTKPDSVIQTAREILADG